MTEYPLSPVPPEASPLEAHQPSRYGNGVDPEWRGHSQEEEGFDWRKYVAALLRFKWVIVLGAVLGGGAGYVAWNQIEPEYVAQGSLWIQAEGGGGRGPIATDGLLQAGSWVDLLRSYSVLDGVVLQEQLYLRPHRAEDFGLFQAFEVDERYLPGTYRLKVSEDPGRLTLTRDRSVVAQGIAGEPIGEEVGIRWTVPPEALTPGREVDFTLITPRDAASRIRQDLVTQIDQRASFIRVELRSRHPSRAAATVNGIMERHVALAAELKRGQLDEQTEILERQLRQVQEELEEAERALEAFRIQTITLPSEERMAIQPGLEMTRAPVFSEFFSMRVEADDRRRDLRRLEQVLDELGDGDFPVEAVEVIPAVMTSSQLQESLAALVAARVERRGLMERYTAEHPQVREVTDRILALEQQRLPALISELMRQLRRDMESLEQRLADSGADLSEIPPRAIEEARLRRRVAIAESLYTDLRGRYEAASLARASSIPDVRILDRAFPPEVPSNDQRARMALVAFLAFVGAGFAAALLLDRMDSRIRTPDEASRAVGLTVIGAVPRLRWSNGKKGTRNVNQVYEAFRELRTNLDYAHGSVGPMVVTISSPSAEEGKTLVTTNLGIAFAGLGRRTIIVDGDTRRGDLHHYLEGQRKPGLTDYLRSTSARHEIVQATAYPGLSFIGSGTHVANSPELISSPRMGRMMAELRKDFDVILVDTPPLGAGADPLVLASLTGNMVLVVRSGSTDREFTQAKLEPLYRLPVRILGMILNDFVPGRLSNYYRYYGSYLPDYEAGVEEEDGEGREVGAEGPRRIVGAASGEE